MIRVYVAGPIGANDEGRAARIEAAGAAGIQLLLKGFAPFVPHLWAAANLNADGVASYEQWMDYDFAWLRQCQMVLRIPGDSPGADREVAEAQRLGLPVVYTVLHAEVYRDVLSRARERHGA